MSASPEMLAYEPAPESGLRRRWVTDQRFWALVDQGCFAGVTFALNVMLGRWLPADRYGAFTFAFNIFLLLATIHNGLMIEPMLVFGPAKFRKHLPEYLGWLFASHWIVAALIALIMLAIGWIAGMHHAPDRAHALYLMAFAGPFLLLITLQRRACYVELNPRRAGIAGIIYLAVMLIVLVILQHTNHLDLNTALPVLGIASAMVGMALYKTEQARIPRRGDLPLVRRMTKDHLRYGQWAAPTGVVGFIPAYLYYLLLSNTEVGALRAMTNFVMPLVTANAALYVLLLPRLVPLQGTPAFARTVRRWLMLLGVIPLLAWLALGLFSSELVHWVYGAKPEYLKEAHLLWWIALQPALTGACGVMMASLQAMNRPERVFAASLTTAITSLSGGWVMTHFLGLDGAVISIVINLSLQFILLAFLLRKAHRGSSHGKGHQSVLVNSPVADSMG